MQPIPLPRVALEEGSPSVNHSGNGVMNHDSSSPDVLLVQPPFVGPYNFWKSESLGMGYLASSLEGRGYSVGIIDGFLADLSIEETVAQILAARPRLLLGFSILSYELYQSTQAIIRQVRAAGLDVHVTIGSWFPTFWSAQIIDEGTPIDSIVLAEGERSVCALADYLRTGSWDGSESFLDRRDHRGVLLLSQKATLLEVDRLPHPRRDFLPAVFERYHLATSYTARGCGYNRCTFCSVPAFYQGGPKHRLRSPGNVADEIEQIARSGANFVFFTDEDFLGEPPAGPARALAIFEEVAARGIPMRYTFNCTTMGVEEQLFQRLVELGLAAVYIGMESNIERNLKRFLKGVRREELDRAVAILRDLGVKLVPGWIMFERDSTLEETEEQIAFLENLGSYHVNYLKALYVMKDTPMERMYADDLYKTYFHSRYYFRDPDVDLLVRILLNDYLPEVMPYTNEVYPIWHILLAGFGTDEQQRRFDRINTRIRELSLCFAREVIRRIRKRSLEGVARELTAQVRAWSELGTEISKLARELGHGSSPVQPRTVADGVVGLGMA
jgi:radical SAM superfamily enzyme YgiQ (UPF0313 family)